MNPSIFWAKLSDDRATSHPLHAHSADVAAVLERLIAPGTLLGARLGATQGLPGLAPRQRSALVYLAALHDLGKANHGFQEKGRDRPHARARGHVKVLLESLGHRPLQAAVRELLAPLGLAGRDATELFRTTVAHHGRPWDVQFDGRWASLWDATPAIPRDPVAEIRRLGALALRWSGLAEVPDGPPLTGTPAFTHLFAGALTLADWLGSHEEVFRLEPDADPETYWATARERAAAVCALTGVSGREVDLQDTGSALMRRIFPTVFSVPERPSEPTRLQLRLSEMALPAPGTRLLVESETGSGKTEAALGLYARLRAAGLVGGLVFALPTRATASAMHERILRALGGIYGDHLPSVALAVGGTQPRSGSNRRALQEEPRLHDEREDGDLSARLSRWASEHSKRFMAAEVVVGTLDQLLLGALPVRHAHLRLAGLTRHLLVVDELHSYDRFMTGVLGRLLDLHTAHGGIALFMSATLAHETRREFGGGAEPAVPLQDAAGRSYPSLSTCPRGGCWREEALAAPAVPKPVQWAGCSLAEGLGRAVEAARSCARVLVLRNTVRGAREAVEVLRDSGAEGLLWSPNAHSTPAYHSRYLQPDRRVLDRRVHDTFGRGTPNRGVILVATQVAEQSLDIDFDLLVTDLCPVDVLLQRIGRLWRHPERTRPEAIAEARAWVVVPENGIEEILASRSKRGPNGWGTVYPDLADLWLTFQLLAERGEILIPRDNRPLVEAVYHPERRDALLRMPEWEPYRIEREGKEFATAQHAKSAALDFEHRTYTGSAGMFSTAAEARIRTRLGDDRVRLPLGEHAVPCRYAEGESVDFVELPEEVATAAGIAFEAPAVTDWCCEAAGVRFRLGEYLLSYTDNGWYWEKRGTAAQDGAT